MQNKNDETNSAQSSETKLETSLPVNEEAQKVTPLRRTKEPKTFLAPLPGYVWNPLRRLPANSPCPCRSLKKFKKCCLNSLPPAVPEALGKEYEKQMALGGLTFLTEANQDRLKEAMPPELWEQKQKELELKRAERVAPASLIVNPWECDHCDCINADELTACADCNVVKPEGEFLDYARKAAQERVKTDATHDTKPVTA